MRRPRWPPLLALGLLGCLTLSLLPLGCSSAKIYRPSVPDDRPRVPEATAERLRACVDELKSTIEPGYYTLDASVKVDQEGRVVEVETTGQPNADVGGCIRIALRGMTLPEDVLARSLFRSSTSANRQVMPERGPIGEVVTVVVVTIVFTEVIIEAFAIAVGVTVTATVAAGAAEAFAKRRKQKEPTCTDRYEACVDKGKDREMGNHWNETLCGTCLLLCNRYNQWPNHLDTGQSCIYPGFK
ncbi:hypothetical protein [Polyangium mundeleinium]|uniref:Lipoprotein n=1 Tax=Polyangium mundeleinium TaxID=2995306 RepID=A0ABT5EZM8_9BACT|nr:hypothetical protein [Polyangium mundeleinium]MDC0747283.1 hypothetical protein [Polyangium mundeleinium]